MSIWTDILDYVALKDAEPPPHMKALRLPLMDGWEPGRVWCTWTMDPIFIQPLGVLFGGYIAALSDHVLSFTIMSVLSADEDFTTSDLRVLYFRPVTSGTLKIEGRVVHRGHHMAHLEAVITRDDGEIVAKATATQVIFAKKPFQHPA